MVHTLPVNGFNWKSEAPTCSWGWNLSTESPPLSVIQSQAISWSAALSEAQQPWEPVSRGGKHLQAILALVCIRRKEVGLETGWAALWRTFFSSPARGMNSLYHLTPLISCNKTLPTTFSQETIDNVGDCIRGHPSPYTMVQECGKRWGLF